MHVFMLSLCEGFNKYLPDLKGLSVIFEKMISQRS